MLTCSIVQTGWGYLATRNYQAPTNQDAGKCPSAYGGARCRTFWIARSGSLKAQRVQHPDFWVNYDHGLRGGPNFPLLIEHGIHWYDFSAQKWEGVPGSGIHLGMGAIDHRTEIAEVRGGFLVMVMPPADDKWSVAYVSSEPGETKGIELSDLATVRFAASKGQWAHLAPQATYRDGHWNVAPWAQVYWGARLGTTGYMGRLTRDGNISDIRPLSAEMTAQIALNGAHWSKRGVGPDGDEYSKAGTLRWPTSARPEVRAVLCGGAGSNLTSELPHKHR